MPDWFQLEDYGLVTSLVVMFCYFCDFCDGKTISHVTNKR